LPYQVLIRVSITDDIFPNERKEMSVVLLVDFANGELFHFGEFKNHDFSTFLQDTMCFTQRLLDSGDIANAVSFIVFV